MTPEQYRLGLDAAVNAAAGAGPEWNRKFVAALDARELRLAPVSEAVQHPDMNLLAPWPFPEGWQYEYPSIVVPKTAGGSDA